MNKEKIEREMVVKFYKDQIEVKLLGHYRIIRGEMNYTQFIEEVTNQKDALIEDVSKKLEGFL